MSTICQLYSKNHRWRSWTTCRWHASIGHFETNTSRCRGIALGFEKAINSKARKWNLKKINITKIIFSNQFCYIMFSLQAKLRRKETTQLLEVRLKSHDIAAILDQSAWLGDRQDRQGRASQSRRHDENKCKHSQTATFAASTSARKNTT